MTGGPQEGVRWAVVGGGMLGLAAARRLRAEGAEVHLYDAAPQLGGLTSAWTLPGRDGAPVVWDRFYHVILGSDRRVRALVDELGLDVVWGRSRAACFSGGRALPASSAAELIGLPFLGPLATLRIALTVARAALAPTAGLDGITAARWLRRWSGRQATERLWLPLLRAKLGRCAERASAVFIASTMRRLVAARFSGGDADRFGHVPGGYATVLDALAGRLRAEGIAVRTGAAVRAVRTGAPGLVVQTDTGTDGFDRVLVTAAGPVAAALCPELDPDQRTRLTGAEYLGVVCPSVLLRRPVTGAYLTYVTDPKPFTAVIEMTALVDPTELAGHTLVYLPRYAAPDDPVFTRSDAEVEAEFLASFQQMYGIAADDVLAVRVARARYVMPVPTPGYAARAPHVRTGVPGLFTVGSAQITVGTLNVEQTLALLEGSWPALDTGPARTVVAP